MAITSLGRDVAGDDQGRVGRAAVRAQNRARLVERHGLERRGRAERAVAVGMAAEHRRQTRDRRPLRRPAELPQPVQPQLADARQSRRRPGAAARRCRRRSPASGSNWRESAVRLRCMASVPASTSTWLPRCASASASAIASQLAGAFVEQVGGETRQARQRRRDRAPCRRRTISDRRRHRHRRLADHQTFSPLASWSRVERRETHRGRRAGLRPVETRGHQRTPLAGVESGSASSGCPVGTTHSATARSTSSQRAAASAQIARRGGQIALQVGVEAVGRAV